MNTFKFLTIQALGLRHGLTTIRQTSTLLAVYEDPELNSVSLSKILGCRQHQTAGNVLASLEVKKFIKYRSEERPKHGRTRPGMEMRFDLEEKGLSYINDLKRLFLNVDITHNAKAKP